MNSRQSGKGYWIGAVAVLVLLGIARALLSHDQYKMVDTAIGAIVLALFIAGAAWVGFWWVRLRRWRRQQAQKAQPRA